MLLLSLHTEYGRDTKVTVVFSVTVFSAGTSPIGMKFGMRCRQAGLLKFWGRYPQRRRNCGPEYDSKSTVVFKKWAINREYKESYSS